MTTHNYITYLDTKISDVFLMLPPRIVIQSLMTLALPKVNAFHLEALRLILTTSIKMTVVKQANVALQKLTVMSLFIFNLLLARSYSSDELDD